MATTPTNTQMDVPPLNRFITLSVRAGEVFANQEKALGWLQTPNPSLPSACRWPARIGRRVDIMILQHPELYFP